MVPVASLIIDHSHRSLIIDHSRTWSPHDVCRAVPLARSLSQTLSAPSHCGPSNHCSKAAASRTRGVSTRWGTRSPIARSRGKTWHAWPALSHAGPARPTRAPGGRRLKGKDIGVLVEDTLEAHMYCTPRVHLVYTSCTSAREHRSKWNTEQVTSTKRESVILFAFAVQLAFNETQKEKKWSL